MIGGLSVAACAAEALVAHLVDGEPWFPWAVAAIWAATAATLAAAMT